MGTESPAGSKSNPFPATYDQFLDQVRQSSEGAVISPAAFQKALALSQGDVAALARVHRVTVWRSPENGKIQGFIREALRVLSSAAKVNDDFSRVAFWFRSEPLTAFGHKTPEQLVAEGRADDVIAYVTSVDAGFAG